MGVGLGEAVATALTIFRKGLGGDWGNLGEKCEGRFRMLLSGGWCWGGQRGSCQPYQLPSHVRARQLFESGDEATRLSIGACRVRVSRVSICMLIGRYIRACILLSRIVHLVWSIGGFPEVSLSS